jgi:hypothetical protein
MSIVIIFVPVANTVTTSKSFELSSEKPNTKPEFELTIAAVKFLWWYNITLIDEKLSCVKL